MYMVIPDRAEPAPRKTGGRRSDYGVVVSNLPRGCSWQDLKDFMRKAGDVIFTDVDKNGDGVVEFSNRDDMEYALKSLHDTEFKNHNESTFIRVKPVSEKSSGRDRSESPARGGDRKGSAAVSSRRSRSPSPAPAGRDRDREDRSRSRERVRSPRSRSRSNSRSDTENKRTEKTRVEEAV